MELAPVKKQIAHVIGAGGLCWSDTYFLLLLLILNGLEMIESCGVAMTFIPLLLMVVSNFFFFF